jgi:hypothetical protein
MRKRALLAIPLVALLGSVLLVDCNQFAIRCATDDNCLSGQACVAALCEDVQDAGGTGGKGTGGAGSSSTGTGRGSASSSTGKGTSGATSSSTGKGTGGTSSSDSSSSSDGSSSNSSSGGDGCPGGCGTSAPHCLDGTCVACVTNADCSGLTPCCSATNTCVFMLSCS